MIGLGKMQESREEQQRDLQVLLTLIPIIIFKNAFILGSFLGIMMGLGQMQESREELQRDLQVLLTLILIMMLHIGDSSRD